MKNQHHLFLQQEGEVTVLHQISNYRGCFYSCETSPPMLASPGVSGCFFLPLGMGNYMSCLPTRQYCNNSPPSAYVKKDTVCLQKNSEHAKYIFEEWPRCCESRNLGVSTTTTFGRGDSYNNGHKMFKRSPRTAGGVLHTVLSDKWG